MYVHAILWRKKTPLEKALLATLQKFMFQKGIAQESQIFPQWF